MILVTADVGGSKTAVAITDNGRRLFELTGLGAAVRPGRTMSAASTIADLVRKALAQTGRIRADGLVVGAAGASRASDAEEVRAVLARERIADRVMVVSDVALALEALGSPAGVVLVAGTGAIALGRTPAGTVFRQGGYGWQMGDEGGGYWIGQAALRAVGLAHDGRGPATALGPALLAAVNAAEFRDLVGWTTVASPREVAVLARAVVDAAAAGDRIAAGILDQAADLLAGLLAPLTTAFPAGPIVLGFCGGLLSGPSPIAERLRARLDARYAALPGAIDPLVGGPAMMGGGGPDRRIGG